MSSLGSKKLEQMRQQHHRELVLRKAMAGLARFKSRQVINKFFSWKYYTMFAAKVSSPHKAAVHAPKNTYIDFKVTKMLTEEDDMENLSEEESKPHTEQKAAEGRRRVVNEMETKLPFSNQAQRNTEENQTEISARVLAGLVPSQYNKTKALSREQEILYTQVLQSQNKDFQLILGVNETEGNASNYYENLLRDRGDEIKEETMNTEILNQAFQEEDDEDGRHDDLQSFVQKTSNYDSNPP